MNWHKGAICRQILLKKADDKTDQHFDETYNLTIRTQLNNTQINV